jgi:hypothetical protein
VYLTSAEYSAQQPPAGTTQLMRLQRCLLVVLHKMNASAHAAPSHVHGPPWCPVQDPKRIPSSCVPAQTTAADLGCENSCRFTTQPQPRHPLAPRRRPDLHGPTTQGPRPCELSSCQPNAHRPAGATDQPQHSIPSKDREVAAPHIARNERVEQTERRLRQRHDAAALANRTTQRTLHSGRWTGYLH